MEKIQQILNDEILDISKDPEYWSDKGINLDETMTDLELFNYAKQDTDVYQEIYKDLDQDIILLSTDKVPDLELIKDLQKTKQLIQDILKKKENEKLNPFKFSDYFRIETIKTPADGKFPCIGKIKNCPICDFLKRREHEKSY